MMNISPTVAQIQIPNPEVNQREIEANLAVQMELRAREREREKQQRIPVKSASKRFLPYSKYSPEATEE